MKEELSIMGIILIVLALALQILINRPDITTLCLWLYVIVRNLQGSEQ